MAGDEDGFTFALGAPDRSAGLYRYEREHRRGGRAAARRGTVSVRRRRATRRRRPTARASDTRSFIEPISTPPACRPSSTPTGAGTSRSCGARSARMHTSSRPAPRSCSRTSAAEARRGRASTGMEPSRASSTPTTTSTRLRRISLREGSPIPPASRVLGGSNGGLMVAVAVTQRPDLWCAACSLVPVTDMLRYHLSPYGETGLREYGDPRRPVRTRRSCARTRRTTTSSRTARTLRCSSSRERTTCAVPRGTRGSSSRACRPTRPAGLHPPRYGRRAPQHAPWAGPRRRVAGIPAAAPRPRRRLRPCLGPCCRS